MAPELTNLAPHQEAASLSPRWGIKSGFCSTVLGAGVSSVTLQAGRDQ